MENRDTQPDVIEFAKQWYNFHPDDKFDSVFEVIQIASLSMEPKAFAHTTARLMDLLQERYYVQGRAY